MSFVGYQDRALFYALSPSWFVSSKAVNSAVTPPNLAGMDGNRTHPGRLSSAPQTVLKTAGLPSIDVHRGPLQFDRTPSDSRTVRLCPAVSVTLAVFLAVIDELLIAPGLRSSATPARGLSPGVRVSGPRLRVQSVSPCSTS